MYKLIKVDFIKNKVQFILPIIIIVTIGIALFIRFEISNIVADYIDTSLDAYSFILLCKIFLLLGLPFCILLVSILFSIIETKDNGWVLVLLNVKKIRSAIWAKYIVNIFLCFSSYVIVIVAGCCFLWDRGTYMMIHAVVLPMLCSFICFIPFALILQMICFILKDVIGKMFIGIVLIMTTLLVSQTTYAIYCFSSYSYTVALDFDMLIYKLGISLILSIAVFTLGPRIIVQKLQKFDL